jgi:type IV pilus assembly protein PilO
MQSTSVSSFNFSDWQEKVQAQFSNLDTKDPASWPDLPKYCFLLGIIIFIMAFTWFFWLSNEQTALEELQARELTLRETYQKKLNKAITLTVLTKQLEQVKAQVAQLEKQLPSKSEMDALLTDINQAGLGRELQFESFKPAQEIIKEHYAELPIAIKIIGKYHNISEFGADIAQLPRIVTLNNLSITPRSESSKSDNLLTLEATVRTFRYLDPDEIALQKKAMGVKK